MEWQFSSPTLTFPVSQLRYKIQKHFLRSFAQEFFKHIKKSSRKINKIFVKLVFRSVYEVTIPGPGQQKGP